MKLFYVCIAWMSGIAIGSLFLIPAAAYMAAGVFACALAATFSGRWRMGCLCLAVLLLGAAREAAAQPAGGPDSLTGHIGETVTVEALLADDGSISGKGVRMRAENARLRLPDGALQPLAGMAQVELSRPPADWRPQYGDFVVLRGRLDPPPVVEGFDYAAYLARQGVYAMLKDPQVITVTPDQGGWFPAAMHAVRRKGLATIAAIFPEPEAALLQGILLGDDSGLPQSVSDAFAHTGTSHIIAISGFNIAIVASILLTLTKKLPRRIPGWLLAILGIVAYTVLVGASASVVRAAIMGSMALIARRLGRMTHGLTTLALSGAVMTLGSPATLWDVGFQLSMAATLGLILYADPMTEWTERLLLRRMPVERARAWAQTVSEVLLLTLAAQITTLPLLLLYFRSLSFSAFVINPLVLPLQPMVMVAAGLAMAAGMIWLPLGRLAAFLAWPSAAYTIRMVEWGATLPGGWQPVGAVSALIIAAYYLVLFGGTALAFTKRLPAISVGSNWASRLTGLGLPVLLAGIFAAWSAYFHLPDGRLHMTMLPAAGGETLLMQSPGGATVLINGGGDQLSAADGVGRRLGFWNRKLDWAVLASTADADSAGWMELAARNQIGGVWSPAHGQGTGKLASTFLDECRRRNIPITSAHTGDAMDLGGGARLVVVTETAAGLVLMAEDGAARWLIPSGIDPNTVNHLLAGGEVPPAQALVLGRGGSPSVNTMDWLRAVDPLMGWSAGGPNAGLAWLDGRTLLRADTDGEVEWVTDGTRMWVWKWR
jgi:competence protein ComEC